MISRTLLRPFRPFSHLHRNPFSTLVIAEHNNGKMNSVTSKVLTAATQFQQETHLLITGSNLASVVKAYQTSFCDKCFQKILVADHPSLENNIADITEHVLRHLIDKNNYTHIAVSSSSMGKDLIPRVAAQYNAQAITDITAILDKDTFVRPIYAGNAFCTVKSKSAKKFLTFRGTSFEPRNIANKVEIKNIENLDVAAILDKADNKANFTQFIKNELAVSDKPELNSAKIVVSGGRALKSKENFAILDQLANALGGAAVGASRAAVDAGYVSNDLQVGQTGKVVAPDLYFAIGISGAIQHLAGMKDSKVIVAINKDGEAPIFQVANYGIVGDLFKIVPELIEKLKK